MRDIMLFDSKTSITLSYSGIEPKPFCLADTVATTESTRALLVIVITLVTCNSYYTAYKVRFYN